MLLETDINSGVAGCLVGMEFGKWAGTSDICFVVSRN